MAATLNITVNVPNGTILQLNHDIHRNTKGDVSLMLAARYLETVLAGCVPANVIITTRDTDPSVGTSGSNSQQITFTHQ